MLIDFGILGLKLNKSVEDLHNHTLKWISDSKNNNTSVPHQIKSEGSVWSGGYVNCKLKVNYKPTMVKIYPALEYGSNCWETFWVIEWLMEGNELNRIQIAWRVSQNYIHVIIT